MACALSGRLGSPARPPLPSERRRAPLAQPGHCCARHRPVRRSERGKITFREYAEAWREAQVHRPSSAIHVEGQLRRHAYPTFGDRQPATILPSEIQAWVRRSGIADKREGRKPLGAETISVLHSIVSAIFRAAVRDRKIIANPCKGTRLPAKQAKRAVPLTTQQVDRLRDLVPDELKTMVTFTAGTGMRQGEVFGLTVDRIDFLRREVRVDRHLMTGPGRGRTEFGPTKTPASNRTIPLPQVVIDALAVHLRDHPAGETGLVFTLGGAPITRYAFGHLWRPIAKDVGIETGTGMHALRHYYASLLIRFGESVKAVQVRLGHASASETLDTYSAVHGNRSLAAASPAPAAKRGDCLGTAHPPAERFCRSEPWCGRAGL